MNRCDELNEYLAAYADGELDETMRERVRTHLDACAECRQELDALKRVDALFRAAPVGEVPERDWQRVSTALDDAMGGRTVSLGEVRERAERRGLFAGWLFPAVALAAAAAIIAVFFMLPGPAPSNPAVEVTNVKVGPGYEYAIQRPATDNDFLIIDVSHVK
jgi:anti-sigma factor RsiW